MRSVHIFRSARNRGTAVGRRFIVAVLIASVAIAVTRPAFAVPTLESAIVAEVLERRAVDASALGIQPAQRLWRFRLRVVGVESVAGIVNSLRGQKGKTLEAYGNEVSAPAAIARGLAPKSSGPGAGVASVSGAPDQSVTHVANLGTQTLWVLFVDFTPSVRAGGTPATLPNKFFGADRSVKDHCETASCGNVAITPAAQTH